MITLYRLMGGTTIHDTGDDVVILQRLKKLLRKKYDLAKLRVDRLEGEAWVPIGTGRAFLASFETWCDNMMRET